MQWSRSILGYGRTMSRGTVALVVIPLIGEIARIALRDVNHQVVPRHLRDDRRAGDGRTMTVALDLARHLYRNRNAGASNVFIVLVM